MPRTLYFFPFIDKTIDSGFIGVISAKTALHGVAPTLARKKFAYLWKMGNTSNTFAHYIGNTDRIYVMGHCSPGDDYLSTEVITGNHTCSTNELANYFCRHGLLKTSAVHIRIHACNSGSPLGNTPSFAQEFKSELTVLGYNNVTVRGYLSGMGYYFICREGDSIFTNASANANIAEF